MVRATSGTGARQQTADQTVLVTVTDVQEPPAAPAAPAVSADSETRLSVAWVEPANTGPRITGYQVRYRTSAPQGDWTEKRSSAVSRRVTIRGLAGDTAYDVQVRAVNDEGDGDWSPPAAARTNANALPVFTAASAAFEVGENGVQVGLVQASDPDSADRVTGSAIVGGADAAAFRLLRGGFSASTRSRTSRPPPTPWARRRPVRPATTGTCWWFARPAAPARGSGSRTWTSW